MSPRKKGAISSFVQSGNFELSSQAGFETRDLARRSPTPYPLDQISLWIFFQNF